MEEEEGWRRRRGEGGVESAPASLQHLYSKREEAHETARDAFGKRITGQQGDLSFTPEVSGFVDYSRL